MAKRERRNQPRRGTPAAPREQTPPRYGQALVAVAGLVLTGVLLWSGATREALPYCAANSGCDIVQGSAWSRFWGLPLALWGGGAYAALGVLAFGRRRWTATALFATSGFGLSLYLTVVGLVVLDAWCVYCLASLALMTAAFVLAVRARPVQGARQGFAFGGGAAVVLALAMHADAYDWPRQPSIALRDLPSRGFRRALHGASWFQRSGMRRLRRRRDRAVVGFPPRPTRAPCDGRGRHSQLPDLDHRCANWSAC